MDLDQEIRKKKTEYEELKAKYRIKAEYRALKNLANEKQLDDLKREISKLEKWQDFREAKKEEGVFQLTIKNRMLKFEKEKEKAERDVNDLRCKFQALLLWLQEISVPRPGVEQSLSAEKSIGNKDNVASVSPCNQTPRKLGDCKADYTKTQRARRKLSFEREKILRPMPAGNANISDSNEELNNTTCPRSTVQREEHVATEKAATAEKTSDEEFRPVSTRKRKRASNVVVSDSENDDDDDDIPLDIRMKRKGNKSSNAPPKRRRVPLRKCRAKSIESDDSEEGKIDIDKIMSNIQRKKERNGEWRFEAEMLADFGKSPELCMRAVCALYRKQTSDEKKFKETLHKNRRGFNKPAAPTGTKLGEFLTGGDPRGYLRKTVEELKKYDPKGVKECLKMAKIYSKQLFEIHQKKEDPLFKPS